MLSVQIFHSVDWLMQWRQKRIIYSVAIGCWDFIAKLIGSCVINTKWSKRWLAVVVTSNAKFSHRNDCFIASELNSINSRLRMSKNYWSHKFHHYHHHQSHERAWSKSPTQPSTWPLPISGWKSEEVLIDVLHDLDELLPFQLRSQLMSSDLKTGLGFVGVTLPPDFSLRNPLPSDVMSSQPWIYY